MDFSVVLYIASVVNANKLFNCRVVYVATVKHFNQTCTRLTCLVILGLFLLSHSTSSNGEVEMVNNKQIGIKVSATTSGRDTIWLANSFE